MLKTNLVIVESPAKAKTIGKYLGPGYLVKASMGHVRDLPKSKLGVDIEGGFIPNYQPIEGKQNVISELSSAAKTSAKVFLATDPDREGEAISWHLKELLGIPDDKTYRVTFNEITKNVVKNSIETPRAIDQNLVDAQQARRILDRIVGYQLSPLLWKKVRRGLSAGRVQSVASRLVAEREDEIGKFLPEEYWSLEADLSRTAPNRGEFKAQFLSRGKEKELKNRETVDEIINLVSGSPFAVSDVKRQDKNRSPAPPFITSTLQQEASRRLNMTPQRTMSIASQLYEGIDIAGEGTIGLITYMRTDSLRLSEEALDAARQFIVGRYGKDYYPPQTRHYKVKSGAQDAHEAIRPSNVYLVPEDVKKDLTGDQFRLYKLIWSRFLACQMASAVYDSVSIEVSSADCIFRATHASLKFAGFTAVYEEGRDEEAAVKQSPLPDLKTGESLSLKELKPEQHFTQPPARYTEATLIRALEEKGIGRPSTYAPIISTILDREYVIKEGKYLRTTPLGKVVTDLIEDKFTNIVDYDFTANMESRLDEVEAGKEQWKKVLADFYGDFASDLKQAEADLDGKRIKVPDEVSDEVCDVCGRNLVVKSGRFGRFLACPGFPECTFTKPLVVEMPGRCPKCGGRILKKTSKKGYTYYGCEFNSDKSEKHCDFMTWDVPLKEDCPVCSHTLFKKSGRGYKKPFCANPECSAFLPEDKRGGFHKKAEGAAGETDKKEDQKPQPKKTASKKALEKKPSARKPSVKKKASAKTKAEKKASAEKPSETSAEKRASAEKKPARKPTAKKTAVKKDPAKKTAAGKTASRKKAVGKTALE